MESGPRGGKRFFVKFGSDDVVKLQPKACSSDAERLRRAMELLDELRLADFMPEEFHPEHDALLKEWARQ